MLMRDLYCSNRFSCGPRLRESGKDVGLHCEMREMMDDMIEVGSLYPDMSVDRSRRFKMTC